MKRLPKPDKIAEEMYVGNTVKVFAVVRASGDAEAKKFFDNELTDTDRKGILAVFQLLDVKKGALSNAEKFKHLLDHNQKSFHEIKKHQLRFGCFWEKDYALYLTHGFRKKSDNWPTGEVEKLKNIYNEYLLKKKNH